MDNVGPDWSGSLPARREGDRHHGSRCDLKVGVAPSRAELERLLQEERARSAQLEHQLELQKQQTARLLERQAELEQELKELLRKFAELSQAAKRQAAPFARRCRKQHRAKPGRKPGHPGAHQAIPPPSATAGSRGRARPVVGPPRSASLKAV